MIPGTLCNLFTPNTVPHSAVVTLHTYETHLEGAHELAVSSARTPCPTALPDSAGEEMQRSSSQPAQENQSITPHGASSKKAILMNCKSRNIVLITH